MQEKALRKVRITLAKPQPGALKGVTGVHNLKVSGNEIHCDITKDFDALLQALAKLPVKDLVIEEASLEDLFMHFYQDAATETHDA